MSYTYCPKHDLAYCAEHRGLCFEGCGEPDTRATLCSICTGIYKPPTSSKLGKALTDEGLPVTMVQAAYAGRYDDYRSDSATPIVDLVRDLFRAGRPDLANRAIEGEWDGTKEEAQEWFEREGKGLLP